MQHQHELSQTSLWQSEWSVPALMQPSHGFWSASLQQQAEQAGPETATVSATATSAAESAGAATATTLLSSPGSSEVDVPSEALAAHSAAFLNAVSRSPALLSSLLPSKPSQGPVSDLIHPKSTLARLLLALPSSLQPSVLLARLSTSFISLYGSSAADAVASSQDADTQEDALLAVIAEAYAVAGADSEEVGSLDTTVAATIAGPYLDASIYARDLNAADPSANPAPPALSSGTHLDSTWDAPAPGPASAPTSTIMVSPWGMAIGLAAAIGLLVIARLGMPALAQAMTPATPLAATAPYGYRLAQQSGGQGYAPSLGYASGIGGSAQARPWWQSPFPSPLSTRGTTVAAAAAAAASPQGEAQREAEANRDGEGGRRLSFPTWFSPWGGQLTSAAVTPASLCLSPVTLGSLRGLALPSSPPSTLASGGLAPRTGGFSGMSGGSALSGLLASCGGASQGLGRRFSLSPLGSVLAALSPVEVAPPSPEDEAGAEQELEEGQEDIGLAVARELLQGGDGECDAYAGALGAMDEGAWDDGLDGGAGAAMQLPETQDLVPTSGRYAAASPYLPGAPAASSPASSLLGSPAVLSAAKAVADMLPSPLSSLLTGGKPTGDIWRAAG